MIEIKVTRQCPSGYGKTPPEIFLREVGNYVDIFKDDVPAAQKAAADMARVAALSQSFRQREFNRRSRASVKGHQTRRRK